MTDTNTVPDVALPAGDPPNPPRLLTWLARHAYGVLALACLVLWLPGVLSLPALDRDESRFAQSSRQMLDSGNFIDIRFGQVPRYKKPVGIYWLQAATTAVAGPLAGQTGVHAKIWTYRLPSLLGGIAAVWLTFWTASALMAAEGALLAALMMGSCILLTAEATIATTDAVLLATVLGVQGVLLRVWSAATDPQAPAPSTRLVMAGWAACAAGILVKFPVVPGVALATIIALVAWTRQWRWLAGLRPLRGLALTALLVAPWVIAITLQSHGAFFQQSLGNDFAAKVAGGQESHGALPGYFLLLSALTFWPAILFIAPGIGLAVTRQAEPGIRFLIAWAGAWWLVVEAVPTKLPHYVLPTYPALAMLAALWLLAARDEQGWRRWLPFVAALQFLAGLVALGAAAVLLPRLYGEDAPDIAHNWPLLASVVVTGLCGLAASLLYLFKKRLMALAPLLLAAFIIIPVLTAFVAPGLSRLRVTEQLAALVAKNRQASDPPPMLAGYQEPSMLFALGADVGLTDGRDAAEQGAERGGLALIEDEEKPRFLARLAELEANAAALGEQTGFNYSRGRTVHVTLYRVAPLHAVIMPSVR